MHLALFYLAKVYQKLKNPIFLHTVIFEILFYFVSYIIWSLPCSFLFYFSKKIRATKCDSDFL